MNERSIDEWLRLGAVQLLSGQFIAATQSYRAAEALDGSNIEAAYALGQIALHEGRFADAVDELQAGLSEHPDDQQLNYAAWVAYMRLGQFEIARQYYRNALTHDSHNVQAGNEHGIIQLPVSVYEPTQKPVPREAKVQPIQRAQSKGPVDASPNTPINWPRSAHSGGPDQQAADQIYKIQVGSERSNPLAQKEWERLLKRYPKILGDISLSVEKADLGAKGIFYRVQAGPIEGIKKAQQRCAELSERKAECLLVRAR